MRPFVTSGIRVFQTVRHLRPCQVFGRLPRAPSAQSPNLSPPPNARQALGNWTSPVTRPARMHGPRDFDLLGLRHRLQQGGWDDPLLPRLWRYNLHYFEDLVSEGAEYRKDWHRDLIRGWISENPPARGTGWEPYPTSQRIINWVKWSFAGNRLEQDAMHSLAVQARWLASNLETHLLGNHLFLNAKALLFAGCLFDGPEAQAWLSRGSRILVREIPEQILADGGQYERSPMYHALALEDMLDMVNLGRNCPSGDCNELRSVAGIAASRIADMRRWLWVMTHPDGEVSFFNDSAMGVAPTYVQLERYADRLGLPRVLQPCGGAIVLEPSGYVRLQNEDAVVIFDAAPLGPDYLPGHGHADTLSIELSVRGKRVLVNSGTSTYEAGPERLRQRGTAAHNTVVVDGLNSSDVWASFRVGRRARPGALLVREDDGATEVSCSHDGYSRMFSPRVHERRVRLTAGGVTFVDIVRPAAPSAAMWHFAPDLLPDLNSGAIAFKDRVFAHIRSTIGKPSVVKSTWHPHFGERVENALLRVESEGGRLGFSLDWQGFPTSPSDRSPEAIGAWPNPS